MDPYNDLLIDAISRNDISSIYYCLRKGATSFVSETIFH